MNVPIWLAVWLAVAATAIWWLLPSRVIRARVPGFLLLLIGGLGATLTFGAPTGPLVPTSLLWLFGGSALVCGALMITSVNPVYSALWFALATLSVCGLFLLQDAPFLAAASVVVYAGAIIVMFLFVIMLVHQGDPVAYNPRAHQPLLASVVSFVLLAGLLTALQQPVVELPVPSVVANSLSHPEAGQSVGTMHGLGRTLFGSYLFAVELAGTLLLVASIGAIAIAPRKEQGTL